jgi:intein/homing endonuclease
LKVEAVSRLNSERLASLVGVVGRSYRDWKRARLNMSLFAAEIFVAKYGVQLPEDVEVMKKRWMVDISNKGKIGGRACYQKYGNFATLEGRKKGGSRVLMMLRERGVIPPAKEFNFDRVKSVELAEFVGILLGDGGITLGQAQITLNSEADREYLVYVIGLIKRLFKFDAPYIKRKNCKANVISCNGVKFVNYLLELGLKTGNKVRQQVEVPVWIKSKMDFKKACVRGLMDTDGGIFVHKYQVNGKYYRYLKLSFVNRSVPLLKFVEEVLAELGFSPKAIMNQENKRVWLYNQSEVLRYLRVVGTSNHRLLKHVEESDSWPIRGVC